MNQTISKLNKPKYFLTRLKLIIKRIKLEPSKTPLILLIKQIKLELSKTPLNLPDEHHSYK